MSNPAFPIRLEMLRQFPARPESEFEWEDLLLRLELMPRALKVHLEGAGGDEVPGILATAIGREAVVQQLLEEVALDAHLCAPPSSAKTMGSEWREGGSDAGSERVPPSWNRPAESFSSEGPLDAAVDRFVRLRGRNFAMLQRRGIDVWNWTIRLPPDGNATVFQLLSLLARDDVEILSRLRSARASMPGAC